VPWNQTALPVSGDSAVLNDPPQKSAAKRHNYKTPSPPKNRLLATSDPNEAYKDLQRNNKCGNS